MALDCTRRTRAGRADDHQRQGLVFRQLARRLDVRERHAPRTDRVPGWPAGLSANTVVLVSTSDRAAALNVAKQARASGLEAGLIRSDPYNLGTGLWIVFSGQFTTPEGATRQAAQLADRYPGAYPQRIQKSQ